MMTPDQKQGAFVSTETARDKVRRLTDTAAMRDMNAVFMQALIELGLSPGFALSTQETARVIAHISTRPDLKDRFARAMAAHSNGDKALQRYNVSLAQIYDPDDFIFEDGGLENHSGETLQLAGPRRRRPHDPPQRHAPKPPVQQDSRQRKANRQAQPNPRAFQA